MNKRIKKKWRDKRKRFVRMRCAAFDAATAAYRNFSSNEMCQNLSRLTKRRNTARVKSEAYIKVTKNPLSSRYIQNRMERKRIQMMLNSTYGLLPY